MREIKFRALVGGEMIFFGVLSDANHVITDEPIMQYAGLKDKHGKEIYEGDIVLYNRGGSDECVSEVTYNLRFPKSEFCLGHAGHRLDETEVIGNIYENPELLDV